MLYIRTYILNLRTDSVLVSLGALRRAPIISMALQIASGVPDSKQTLSCVSAELYSL